MKSADEGASSRVTKANNAKRPARNLRDFLERRECAVVQIDAETLEVELPHGLHAQQARLELDLYLRIWHSLHEWSALEYVEKPLGSRGRSCG